VKKIILILLVAFSVTSWGQQNKIYYIEDLNSINDSISEKIELYASTFSHDLDRNIELDKRAKLRNSYFISLVQQTSKTGGQFSDIVDSIPDGKIGHTECFGKPTYFSPSEVKYPELFCSLHRLNLKVKGEIMYQVIWSNVLNQRQTSHVQLIQKAVNDIKKTYNVTRLSQKVINEYKNSKSHNEIIKQRGDGEYGSSTMYIIAEKKMPNGKWKYEVMIRNLILFTEPIN
jgi:hypothetical protein